MAAAALRLTVISDFQQIRCRLELLSRLGRAKGRTCGRAFSRVPPVCQPFRRTDGDLITDRYLSCSSKSTPRQYHNNLTKDFMLRSGVGMEKSVWLSVFKGRTNVNISCFIICKNWTWMLIN